MAMTVVDKDCTEKAEDFTDYLLNMGYTKGMKDGYVKAIEEFAEKMKELFKHIKVADSVIDMVVKEMKGEQP